MAYLVSQLRKTNSGQNTYMTPVTGLQASQINSPNPFGDTSNDFRFFQDFALEGNFQQGVVYYLRFKIRKIPQYFYSGAIKNRVSSYKADADILNLQILLKNNLEDDEEEIPPEVIGTCFVPMSYNQNDAQYSSYSFVFTPSKNFNRLGFRINRVSFDAIERNFNTQEKNNPRNWLRDTNEKTTNGYRSDTDIQGIPITVNGPRIIWYNSQDSNTWADADLCILNNLVSEKGGWLKFGYQCRPGALIVVNGEPIRVGRSGIYEINNGTIIQSFMIANPGGWQNSKIDAFLLDYAYKAG